MTANDSKDERAEQCEVCEAYPTEYRPGLVSLCRWCALAVDRELVLADHPDLEVLPE